MNHPNNRNRIRNNNNNNNNNSSGCDCNFITRCKIIVVGRSCWNNNNSKGFVVSTILVVIVLIIPIVFYKYETYQQQSVSLLSNTNNANIIFNYHKGTDDVISNTISTTTTKVPKTSQTVYETITIPQLTSSTSSSTSSSPPPCSSSVPKNKKQHQKQQHCQIRFRNERMSLCYYLPYGSNFGDELGPAVAQQLLRYHFGTVCNIDQLSVFNLRTEGWKRWMERRTCFFTLGSILHMVQENDSIWGTGTNPYWFQPNSNKKPIKLPSNITIYATRGPQTWNLIKEQQQIVLSSVDDNNNNNNNQQQEQELPKYGDPGFLTPFLYPYYRKRQPSGSSTSSGSTNDNNRYCIVPHFHDIEYIEQLYKNDPTVTIISPKNKWEYVVERLASQCDYIASSSLHGLIIADALQIPSQWVQKPNTTTATIVGHYKFIDYYESIQRYNQKPIESFEQIKNSTAYIQPLSNPQYQSYVTTMIQSFPYHLFETKCV